MSEELDYDETEHVTCPRCDGLGSVECYCGGDLCVCENYGEAVCKTCAGDGEVTEAMYDAYLDRRRASRAWLEKAFAGGEADTRGAAT